MSSNITYGSNSTLYASFRPPVAGITPGFLYNVSGTKSSNFIFDSVSNVTNAIRSNIIYSNVYSNTQTSYVFTNTLHSFLSLNSNFSSSVVAQFIETRSNATATNNYICTLTTQPALVSVGVRPWTGY
jgi:hypothetical protein